MATIDEISLFNRNRLNHLMPSLKWKKQQVKWGGSDYTRALWLKEGFHARNGKVYGPTGENYPLTAPVTLSDFEEVEPSTKIDIPF